MQQRNPNLRQPAAPAEIEHLLTTRYSQLLQWGIVLTQGDPGKAQDIVQELCLYFTLATPNLAEVTNLDGYLYTCLRHIYLSGLSRASREATRLISVADFDSFEWAIAASQGGELLQRQNDLRRICGYAIWRKEKSKSASYFILHFFHGYSRLEIAVLARLPISAIYNKLKTARTDVRSHLEESGKLRLLDRQPPPVTPFVWTLLSPGELFTELRRTILHARTGACLPEKELLAYYTSSPSTPIPCALLSHIVSCERCLAIIDQHFQRPGLMDREPLDCLSSSSDADASAKLRAYREVHRLELVKRRRRHIHEHRPNSLSIALNGKVIAFHDVQSQHSTLSARVDEPKRDLFIEVFSEQDVRLALVSITDLPPDGPSTLTQVVNLSDSRWLELNLTFDGLGLNSQVVYYDPALAAGTVFDEAEDAEVPVPDPATATAGQSAGKTSHGPSSQLAAALGILLRFLIPSTALSWSCVVAILVGTTAYLAYRHTAEPMSATEVLRQSMEIEHSRLLGQTEHQVVRVEEISADGTSIQQGSIDLWKDGDGSRYLRRVYDTQHRLVAAAWRNKRGESVSRPRHTGRNVPNALRELVSSDMWNQDLSASAFKQLGSVQSLTITPDGYQLMTQEPIKSRPSLVSATLVLNRQFLPVQEMMQIHTGTRTHRFRLMQTSLQLKASTAVPDSVFESNGTGVSDEDQNNTYAPAHEPPALDTNVRLAQLQIAALYELKALDADVGQPVEVVRTQGGRIRVAGAIADQTLRLQVVSHLMALPDHSLLDLQLNGTGNPNRFSNIRRQSSDDASVYEVDSARPLAEPIVRARMQAKGISGKTVDASVEEYSRDTLRYAQHALQDAYALDRLGDVFSASELGAISVASQRQWTEMVYAHAADLDTQLQALRTSLVALAPDPGAPLSEQPIPIETASQFAAAASAALHREQEVNENVGKLFTANASGAKQQDAAALLSATIQAIPWNRAQQMIHFATRLRDSGRTAVATPQKNTDAQSTHEPQW